MRPGRLRLYWDTARALQGEQLRYQARRRFGVRRGMRLDAPILEPGFDVHLPQRTSRCHPPFDPEVLMGRFTSWGVTRSLRLDAPWEAPALGVPWHYPVHYFEYAPPIAARGQRDPALASALQHLLLKWIDAHPPGCGVGWEPYPTALRIVSWLDVLETLGERLDAPARRRIVSSLWQQAAWLHRHLERHLGGTHLLKDAKALLVAAAAFGARAPQRWGSDARALLHRELRTQVRDEGSHLEPSVYYHDLAFGDVLDLLDFGVADPELHALLEDTARRMAGFTAALQDPQGRCPLLGDAAWDGVPAPRDLLDYARRLGIAVPEPAAGLRFFAASGLGVWRDARSHVVVDAGGFGPPHLAAHGHCDSLSFEWHVDGEAIVVDSGTSSYEVGTARTACRSTRAHNTIQVDGREQHEIWEAFRVARRAAVAAHAEVDAIEATLVPWHDRRIRVTRRFEFGAGRLILRDRITGPGAHRIETRLHLHPDCTARLDEGTVSIERGAARATIRLPEALRCTLRPPADHASFLCEKLGVARPSWEIHCLHEGDLPFETTIECIVG